MKRQANQGKPAHSDILMVGFRIEKPRGMAGLTIDAIVSPMQEFLEALQH